MSRNCEEIFKTWSKGPGDSEEQRISNAIKQIKEAISNSDVLKNRNIEVFVQGSYRNRVNVRNESDIDTGVVCYDTFFPDYSDDNVKLHFKNIHSDSKYSYREFKNDIEKALVSHFGRSSVSRGNKAFDIKENSYRVEADVAAFFEHRRYNSIDKYISGVQLSPDNGIPPKIVNWPEQHYSNGVGKNDKTNRRYKRTVRILKKLTIDMCDNHVSEADKIPGFLIECLVWNVPNNFFSDFDSYVFIIKAVLDYLFVKTTSFDPCREWGEVSELKYLFRESQPWTVDQVHSFVRAAQEYLERN